MSSRRQRLKQLYEQHSDYVWCCLRRLKVDERDLADLCHEVFLVVYDKLDDYDESRAIKPWLFGIAYRIASNYRDRARRDNERLDKPDRVPGSTDIVDEISGEEARDLVMEALEDVDMEKRAVFILHKLDDHEMPEVAEAMSIPTQTAYSRFRSAKQQFEASVKNLVSEEYYQ